MSRGTKLRHVRLDDAMWEAFGQIAESRGTNRAALLRAYIEQEIERSRSATGDLFDTASASRSRR